ncbi:MAG TPA: peptidyl-prolyl cis-trans isomerase [bacterium]|nr:peptidyl-prolyl cis-trans isomerase [bacterium]
MKRFMTIAGLAAALAWVMCAVSGCGGCGYDEKKPIATVDGKSAITVGDFVYHYKRAVEMAPPQDKPVINTFDDAKDFLDDIVTSRVLEIEAEALGYGKDENLVREMEMYRSNLLRERMRSKVAEEVKVTEAEILDFYNKNKEWRRVSFIMCDKKGQAEKAHAELAAGKPWNDVVKKYSTFEGNRDQGGKAPEDFYYSGDNVSRAVYEAEVGKYTPVVEIESGDLWLIFRVDEKVPGQKDEYAKVKDNVRDSIKQYKVDLKMKEYLAKVRKDAPLEVNKALYDAMMKDSIADLREKYNRKGEVISKIGDVPVYFDSWFEGMFLQMNMSEGAVDEYKRKELAEFKKVMDSRLKALEDDALLEYDAVRTGADKEDDFIRDLNRFRAGKMVDRIYEEVFLPTIPAVTEGDVKEYFENHKPEFQEQERAEVYVVAFPDKAALEEVHAKVKAGGDVVAVSGEYMEKIVNAMIEAGQMDEEPPPGDMPMASLVPVNKEPAPTPPGPATGPEGGGEAPILGELRPRVFKAKKGDLSDVFKLKDGRWAFFKYWEYYPFVQHTLDEEDIATSAKDGAHREKLASPEVDRRCQTWFNDLRAKHKIEIDDSALKMAYKKVQKL